MSTALRLLLVEDCEADAVLLLDALKAAGLELEATRAASAEQMVGLLGQGRWDCIISDHGNPGMDGLSATAGAREMGYDGPFIVVSDTAGEAVVEAMRAGADDFVLKDNLGRLPAAVERALRDDRARRQHRRQLTGSEERSARILRENADAVLVVDDGGVIVFANLAADHLLGRLEGELVGARFDFPVTTGAPPVIEILSGHEARSAEMRVVSTSWASRKASIVSLRDVTERIATEERRRFLNRLLHAVSEVNGLMVRERDRERLLSSACMILAAMEELRAAWIGIADPASGAVEPAAAAGVEADAITAAGFRCDDAPSGRGPVRDAIRDGRTVVTSMGEHSWSGPLARLAEDLGCQACVVLPLEVRGVVIGVISVLVDRVTVIGDETLGLLDELAANISFALEAIETEALRRDAEDELARSEERFRSAFESSGVGMALIGLDGRFLAVNQAICEILGHTAEHMLGLSFHDITDARDLDLTESRFAELVAGSISSCQIEARYRHSNGSVVWGILTVSASGGGDGPLHAVAQLQDITARKTAEEQLLHAQKMEAVGRLASGIAHDFNNLLQAVLGVSQSLRLIVPDDDEAGPHIDELEDLVRRGAQLSRQLLLFSRQDPGKIEELDLNQVVEHSSRILRRVVRENIAVDISLGAQPLPVRGDRGQLEQVLMNLVVNASDAMSDGGRLTISARGAGDEVHLVVSDTGHGIPAEIQQHLFEPFFTTKERGKGTGLGLSVVHGIVSRHGGRIELDSTSERGTTFVVTLPRGSFVQADTATLVEHKPSRAAGERVMVVEDDAGVRFAVQRMLQSQGYQVVSAGTGDDARAHLDSPPFDLLLSDFVLPDCSGLELARELSAIWPGLSVLLMSGYAQDDILQGGIPGATLRFLAKPFDSQTLIRAVAQALRQAGGDH